MINSVHIVGNLTRDPEIRSTDNGVPIGKLTVAINEYRGKGEEKTKVTHFIDCVAFGGIAEAISKFSKKGDKVTISGRLSQSKWKNDAGENRSKLEIIIEDIEFLSPKHEATAEQSSPEQDDIPFN